MLDASTPTNWDAVSDPVIADNPRFANDSKLFVQFHRKAQLQKGESDKQGRAIYKEVDYIKIMVPGDKTTIIDRPVNSIDEKRFADRYAKWKAGAGNVMEGTPISALPRMSLAKVEEYKYFGIHTVEQLASAADVIGQKFLGFGEDKRAANAFLEIAKGNAPIEKMNEELKARDTTIAAMQEQIAALMKMMEGQTTPEATAKTAKK
jgi:hypothetical protein